MKKTLAATGVALTLIALVGCESEDPDVAIAPGVNSDVENEAFPATEPESQISTRDDFEADFESSGSLDAGGSPTDVEESPGGIEVTDPDQAIDPDAQGLAIEPELPPEEAVIDESDDSAPSDATESDRDAAPQ